MDEKNYNSDQDKDWNPEYNQNKEEDSDDFGLPDVSYDPYKKDKEQSYDYGQPESNADQSSEQNQTDDYNQGNDYSQSAGYTTGSDYSSSGDQGSDSYGSYEGEKKEDQYNDERYDDDYQKDNYDDEYNYDDPYYDDDDENTDNTGKVLMIILAILILAAGLFAGYWFWLKDIMYPPDDNMADTEVVDETAGDDGMTESETNAVPPDALEENTGTTSQGAGGTSGDAGQTSTPSGGGASGYATSSSGGSQGNISTIQSRTGNYWLVVGSFVDDDMALDYGKKLANSGTGSFLIYPYGDTKYYRLAVDKAGSWTDAENLLNNYRSRYGNDVWILKY